MASKEKIVESLLEAVYYQSFWELFEDWAQLNNLKPIKVIKPSQREEKFLGFDYAWVQTGFRSNQYMHELQGAINSNDQTKKYWGFFLQYKIGEPIKSIRKKSMPNGIKLPMNRCLLSTRKDAGVKFSQHELLKRLSGLPEAQVYYAVPEIFSSDDVPRKPSLSEVRLFQVDQNTPLLNDNSIHHAYFKPQSNDAIWFSEPVPFESLTLQALPERLPLLSAEQLQKLLLGTREVMMEMNGEDSQGPEFPHSLRIIEFQVRG